MMLFCRVNLGLEYPDGLGGREMRKISVIGVLLVLPVAACAGLPRDPKQDGISVPMLVNVVQCELANGYRDARFHDAIDQFAAGVELNLKVTNQGTAALVVPVELPALPNVW